MLQLDLEPATRQLQSQVGNALTQWSQRHSVLLRLRYAGYEGLGEATPLPGFSLDHLHQAQTELSQLSPERLAEALNADRPQVLLQRLHALPLRSASAHFALQSAALGWFAARRAQPVWQLLAEIAAAPASTADALRPETRQPEALALPIELPLAVCSLLSLQSLLATQTGHFKAKISSQWSEHLPLLQRWRQDSAAEVTLRLDANRTLPAADLEWSLAQLACLQPEFIEEPCALAVLGEPRRLPVALAFDESLAEAEGDPVLTQQIELWCRSGAVAALVLKPMLLGSAQVLLTWLERARSWGVEVIFSHLFDGALAFEMYHAWARAFGSRKFAMGLGSHPGLTLWSEQVTAGGSQ